MNDTTITLEEGELEVTNPNTDITVTHLDNGCIEIRYTDEDGDYHYKHLTTRELRTIAEKTEVF